VKDKVLNSHSGMRAAQLNRTAIQALNAALARPSSTPCTWREDRDAYLAEQKAALLAHVIEPVTVQAVANDWAQKYVANTTGDVKALVAVARHDDKWLLFDPKDGTFALAYGTTDAMPLGLLGFSSPDALAEWLG
jgi:hypothetical protein